MAKSAPSRPRVETPPISKYLGLLKRRFTCKNHYTA